ncbi:MAG: hypothetical protein N3B18_04825 [Desulfobacterota bacterium]|nr:hypothetical protein [Thermodesulfobacteriota bacterium]
MERKFSLVLISEKSGKSYSLKIQPVILLCIVVVIFVLTVVSVMSSAGYITLCRKHDALLDAYARLERELHRIQKETQSRTSLQLFPEAPNAAPDKLMQPTSSVKDNQTGTVQNFAGHYTPIAIEAISVHSTEAGHALRVSFRLLNRTAGTRITGYLCVVAYDDTGGYGTWPELEVKDGVPREYRRGHAFSILRYKYIEAHIKHAADGQNFTRVAVLVYDEHGNLMARHEHACPSLHAEDDHA